MKRCLFPMGLGYLAAVLEKNGILVSVLDCIVEGYDNEKYHKNGEMTYGLEDGDILKKIRDFDPDFVGVSCLISRQAHNAHRMCKLAKEIDQKIQTIMGGCHPSVLSQVVKKDINVDHVVIGSGENAIVEIVAGNTQGIVDGGYVDVKELPWPARHLFPLEKYLKINMPTSIYSPHSRVTQIEFTRSCPFNCSFCSTTQFRGRYQKRRISDCIEEVRFLKNQYKINELDIIDSNFIVDKKWTKELLLGLKKVGISWANPGGIWLEGLDEELLQLMKDSGCYQLSLAVESSTPKILEEVINKPIDLKKVRPIVRMCRKLGIDLHAFFVCGFPEQTRKEILNDYYFAKEMGFTSASFNIICPLPGSRLYHKYSNFLDFDQVDLRKASIPHPEMTSDELVMLVDGMNKMFNSSLIYRDPFMFIKKYIATIIRKPSFHILRRLFSRQ
ncbi:MAG: B12-binding domain-containing radical SAM protein [Desulfobacterales bacterium]|nr:B12-binding domain-containing radical SAM protein [Desulfobacterales bacterium]MBF0398251.1 B12-binding domain-containing radical SAM protein [Desulfobacterales bacterium]